MKTISILGTVALVLVGEAAAGGAQSPVIETKGTTIVVTTPPALQPVNGAWTIKRDWNRREVQRYAQWITAMYEKKISGTTKQRQAKLSTIVKDPEMNLLLQPGFADDNNDPRKIDEGALNVLNSANACGTLPILCFVYYCAVRGLPCTFTKVEGRGGDIRYSRGNHPTKRLDPLSYGSLKAYASAVFFGEQNYTTGNWRTAPDLEGTDTVPVAVTPEATVPGLTVMYNPDGHGLMVARVTSTGNVNILDAHPDGSITTGQTLASVEAVVRAIPSNARDRWYAGWRMIRFAKCVTDGQGRITGIRPYTNAEMRAYGYSDEQYTDIVAMRKGLPVMINGQATKVESYPEYVRMRLTTVKQLDPCKVIDEWANQLHILFTERANFVQRAWADVLANGAIALPDDKNIYQAEGRWEDWSSPSSDCDRKGAYFLGVDQLEAMVRDFDPSRSNLILTSFGRPIRTQRDLAQAIAERKRKAFEERKVSYQTSRGVTYTLTLSQIEYRLFLLSFDPNHAPEIRWGGAPDSPECKGYRRVDTPLASGGSMSVAEGYRREQRLRYRLCRKEGRTWFDDPDNPTGPKPLLEARLGRWLGATIASVAPKRTR